MYLKTTKRYYSRFFHIKYSLDSLTGVRGKVLDIGCGKGAITSIIKSQRRDLKIVGIDKNPKDLSLLKKSFSDSMIKLVQGNAEKLPFSKESFDAAIMIDVLEHLDNPQKALFQAARVVKKGGMFHLVVPLEAELTTIDGWIKKIFGKNLKRKPIGHIHQFKLNDVQKMLISSGFKIGNMRYSYHFIYQLISFFYFAFVYLFKRGKYLPLVSKNKEVNWSIDWLSKALGWLIFLESSLFAKVKGQTLHVAAIKI